MMRGFWERVSPEIFGISKLSYSVDKLFKDLYAGLIVSIISFPLAMALAIASGASPDKGLITSMVAGFFTSLIGGCRYQIGGPTGAFVVIIFNIINNFGYDGLILATFMAGIILIIAGFLGVGKIIEYIPYPVTAGFTTGIGVTILTTQIKDLLGIQVKEHSADFINRVSFLFENFSCVSYSAMCLGLITLLVILILQKYKPLWPRFLIALLIGVLSVIIFADQFETVGERFSDLKWEIPSFGISNISYDMVQKLFPSAITIAFLAGIESLLCAVVVDSMTSTQHKSDSELIGQGISNIFSALIGGLPATGAIARTAANVKAGAVSSFSGLFHAIFVGIFMYFLLEYMEYIPIACLSGILITVAWNMMGFRQCQYIMKTSKSDISVFLVTLILTIMVDITVAVEVGVLIASFLFIKRIKDRTEVEVFNISHSKPEIQEIKSTPDNTNTDIQCIKVHGPMFFGIASIVENILKQVSFRHKVLILNFEEVPLIDATCASTIRRFVLNAKKATVILTNLKKYPYSYLTHIDRDNENIYGYLTKSMDEAINIARQVIESQKK